MQQLQQMIAIPATAAGAQAVATVDLNILQGLEVTPDIIAFDNPAFDFVSLVGTTLAVVNEGASEQTTNIWLVYWHSVERSYGSASVKQLSPAPFVMRGAGSGGARGGTTPRYTPDLGKPVHTEIRYCRPGGSNDNDGLTTATAWADGWDGLKKGLDWYQTASYGLMQQLDITDCTIVIAEEIQIGGGNIGGSTYDINVNCTAPDTFCAYVPFQIVASVQQDLAVTVTLAAQDTNSKLWVVTVAQAMVVNAHRGKNLLSEGIFEWGTIEANTANQLLVASSTNPSTWTGQVGIYSRSARIECGNPASFGSCVKLQAMGSWYFAGIDFGRTAGMAINSVTVTALSATYFQMCSFEGVQLTGGSEETYFDACYVHGGETLTIDAGGCAVFRESAVYNTTPICHGTDHSRFFATWFDSLQLPLGSGSLSISQFTFDVVQCQFDNCPAGALIFLDGNCRLQHAKVEHSVGPIVVSNPGTRLEIINVGGATGNTGTAGCVVQNGAQVDVGATVTVSSAGGQRKIGGNAVGNWATVPETDVAAVAPQFCRAY